jgi:hypothetical protein
MVNLINEKPVVIGELPCAFGKSVILLVLA